MRKQPPFRGPSPTIKKNMGTTDRMIRLILSVIVVTLYFTNIISGTWGILLMVIVAFLLPTSFIGICPLYLLTGTRTNRRAIGIQ